VDVPPGAVESAGVLDDDAPSVIIFHFETKSRLPIPVVADVAQAESVDGPSTLVN
jgi:hypothetical protein